MISLEDYKKETKGKANPGMLNKMFVEELNK